MVIAIALIAAIVGPLLLAYLFNVQRSREKREQWQREDTAAATASEMFRALLDENRGVKRSMDALNEQIDVIHVLVNSNMTAAMQAELDATVRDLASMREVIDLKRAAGHAPTPIALAAVKATEEAVAELTAKLGDRLKQNAIAEKLKAEQGA